MELLSFPQLSNSGVIHKYAYNVNAYVVAYLVYVLFLLSSKRTTTCTDRQERIISYAEAK